MMEVFKEFTFDAAHWLPNVPDGHQCGRMHGHTYRVRLTVAGEVDPTSGFVIDFGDLKGKAKPVIDSLDHTVLNDSLANPTCENLAIFLGHKIDGLSVIEVWETPTSGCRLALSG
jgi:6-pyruvoyltetrahydropterin/6-carboxytetrahydropterin synthase